MIKAILAVIIGAVILIVVMTNVDKATTDDPGTGEVVDTKLTVSINGQVNKEGTYYIDDGGTLNDLITAAGGVTSNADELAFEPSYKLKNNLSFYIAPKYETSSACDPALITKYNINTASQEELTQINHVDSGKALAIVAYRDNGGHFDSIEELINVKGIGNTTFYYMRDYVTIK